MHRRSVIDHLAGTGRRAAVGVVLATAIVAAAPSSPRDISVPRGRAPILDGVVRPGVIDGWNPDSVAMTPQDGLRISWK